MLEPLKQAFNPQTTEGQKNIAITSASFTLMAIFVAVANIAGRHLSKVAAKGIRATFNASPITTVVYAISALASLAFLYLGVGYAAYRVSDHMEFRSY